MSESFARLNRDGCFLRTSQIFSEKDSIPFSGSFPTAGMMLHGQLYRLPHVEQVTSGEDSGFWPTPTVQDAENNGGIAQHLRNTLAINAVIMYPEHLIPVVLNDKIARIGFYLWAIDKYASGMTATQIRKSVPADAIMLQSVYHQAQQKTELNTRNLIQSCMDAEILVTGKTNPEFVEWLMGWPLGWTESDPLEMDRFLLWQQQRLKSLKILCGVAADEYSKNDC